MFTPATLISEFVTTVEHMGFMHGTIGGLEVWIHSDFPFHRTISSLWYIRLTVDPSYSI
jgi:hypothetical protein